MAKQRSQPGSAQTPLALSLPQLASGVKRALWVRWSSPVPGEEGQRPFPGGKWGLITVIPWWAVMPCAPPPCPAQKPRETRLQGGELSQNQEQLG